jgi:hypothetical protein
VLSRTIKVIKFYSQTQPLFLSKNGCVCTFILHKMKFYKSYYLSIIGIIILIVVFNQPYEAMDFSNFIIFNNLVLVYICFFYFLDIRFDKYLFDHSHYLTLPIKRTKLVYKEILLYILRLDVVLIQILTFIIIIKNQTFLINYKPSTLFIFFVVLYIKYILFISILVCATQWTPRGYYNIKKSSLNIFLTINVLIVFTLDNNSIQNYSPIHGLLLLPFIKKDILLTIGIISILVIIIGLLLVFINKYLSKWPIVNV